VQLRLFRVALRAIERNVRARDSHRLVSFQQINEILRTERARTERNGGKFSLVLFGPIPDRLTFARVGRTLSRRARSTDHLGHFRDSRLCAILPDTPSNGARAFALDVIEILESRLSETSIASPTPFEVFSFPTPPSGNDDFDRDGNAGWDGRPREAAIAGRRRLLGTGESRLADIGAAKGFPAVDRVGPLWPEYVVPTVGVEAGRAALARSLDDLLMRPLPVWKRATDISGAIIGILAASPIMLLAAMMIKLTSPGPVLFQQHRCGLGGKPFKILKFRTMVADADRLQSGLLPMNEQDGPAFKIRNDPRITPIGRLLRKTSLDELPQLLNVLRGEMSLVGPRPLPVKEQHACSLWQRRRLDVTPGLTCIWQVAGRSTVSFDKWVRMDVNYIRRRTLIHDLKILVQTVPAVLLGRGAK
jgi:lipopolysaccharide/colanic/teichoic acid biosynthesis glycosyltransferase